MGHSKPSSWLAGTAAVCVLLLAGSWFLLIAPVLDAASQTRAQVEQVEQQNADLRARTVELREQFADIDRLRAELAGLEAQIPTDSQVADLLREIDLAATSSGVTIVSVGAADALGVVPAAPAAAATTPSAPAAHDAAAPATAEEPAAAPAATPAATPAAVEGLIAIPLTVTVVGRGANVTDFIAALQTELRRLVLVDSLTGTALPTADPTSGRPASAVGDLEMVLTGYAYVVLDPAATPPADATTADGALPAAPGNSYPFAPNSGASAG